MRKLRQALPLAWEAGLGWRLIGHSRGLSPTTVGDYLRRAELPGLYWPLPAALEARLFPGLPPRARQERPLPDFADVHREFRRQGVTLVLLWQQYSPFCEHYRRFVGSLDLVMHQGPRVFIDDARQTVPVVDPATGEVRQAPGFVAPPGPPTTPTPRRRGPRAWWTGSPPPLGPWSPLAPPRPCGSPTTSRARCTGPVVTSPSPTPPIGALCPRETGRRGAAHGYYDRGLPSRPAGGEPSPLLAAGGRVRAGTRPRGTELSQRAVHRSTSGLDRRPLPAEDSPTPALVHDHVRDPDDYS
jgi:hypothetical protein